MELINSLLEIEIENYKSFTKGNVIFDNITCSIGPNESGKTNLLEAVYHLSYKRQKTPYDPRDLRINAPGYPNGEISISYKLLLSKTLLGQLFKQFPNLLNKTIILTKSGCPKQTPTWRVKIDIPHSSIPNIVSINNKQAFTNKFKSNQNDYKIAKLRSAKGWFISDSSVDLRKNPYKQLLEDKRIILLTGKEKLNFLKNLIIETVLKNVKIFKWTYSEKDFLPDTVPLEEFIENPSKFKTVASIFEIAGWKWSDFSKNLQNQDDSVYDNLLSIVKRYIDSLIKNNWSTHQKLKIQLQHKGAYLTIRLEDPGSSTPPEYRSDGLKWFLTFLINFRAQSKSISNYILLIDEPGLHLHPRGQKDTLEELENLFLKYKNQIIYTTHQTFLINKNKPERIRIFNRKIDKAGKHLSKFPFYASKISNIDNPKSILNDKLLREALGFKVSDISPINEKNILVEGVFDRDIFQITNNHWQIIDLNETSVIACGKASDIKKHAVWYKANDLVVVCFYDSDNPGKSSFNQNNKVTNKEKTHIKKYINKKKYETMEDLIPDKVFDSTCKEWFKKWNISDKTPTKPRMKILAKYLPKDNNKKFEMKHSLENIIVKAVEKDIKKNENDYSLIRKILEDLKRRLP